MILKSNNNSLSNLRTQEIIEFEGWKYNESNNNWENSNLDSILEYDNETKFISKDFDIYEYYNSLEGLIPIAYKFKKDISINTEFAESVKIYYKDNEQIHFLINEENPFIDALQKAIIFNYKQIIYSNENYNIIKK